MTDAELIAAVAESDRTAFRLLYERHAPWLMLRLQVRLLIGRFRVDSLATHDQDLKPAGARLISKASSGLP